MPIEALASRIGADWAEAQRLDSQRQAEWGPVLAQRDELHRKLAAAREAQRAAATQVAVLEEERDARQQERRQQEREANLELAEARAEHRVMSQVAADMQKVRPELLGLIRELREGNREGMETQQALADELATLRTAVRRMERSRGAGGTISGPKALPDSETSDSWELVPAEAAAERERLRQATEEHDHLHKRLLELQDENARLVEEQEGLIQQAKGRVELLKRQRHTGT